MAQARNYRYLYERTKVEFEVLTLLIQLDFSQIDLVCYEYIVRTAYIRTQL